MISGCTIFIMSSWLQNSFDNIDLRVDLGVGQRRSNSRVEHPLHSTPKSDDHKTVEISAQERPQLSKTSQDNLAKINSETATLRGAAQSDHSSHQAAAALLPVQRQGTREEKYSKKRFLTPKNWERQVPRALGSITRYDRDVTVFAVVSKFNPPKQSKGTDWYCRFELVDQTLHDSYLHCMCFQQSARYIPLILEVGDIIKLPFRIKLFNGNIQGQTYDDHFPWMTFDGRPDEPIVPRYSPSPSKPTFTNADKKKVEELRSWAVSVGIAGSRRYVSVARLTEDLYFDYLCQVIHVDDTKNVLHVWDGTEPSHNGLLSSGCNTFVEATKWGRKIIGRCVVVQIFGCDLESTCKAGQYIVIQSLHFFLKDTRQDDGVVKRIPFLTLHERMLTRGGVKILNDDDYDVINVLERRMRALSAPPSQQSDDSHNVAVNNKKHHPDAECSLSKEKIKQLPKRETAEGDNREKIEIPDLKVGATVQKADATADGVADQSSNKETTIGTANANHLENIDLTTASSFNVPGYTRHAKINQVNTKQTTQSGEDNSGSLSRSVDEKSSYPRDIRAKQTTESRVGKSGASKRVIVRNIVIETSPLPTSLLHDGRAEQTKVSTGDIFNISNSVGNEAMASRVDKSDGPHQGKMKNVLNETRELLGDVTIDPRSNQTPKSSAGSFVKPTVLSLKVRPADVVCNASTNETCRDISGNSNTVIKTVVITPGAPAVDVSSGASKRTVQSHVDVSHDLCNNQAVKQHTVDQTCSSVSNRSIRTAREASPTDVPHDEVICQTKRMRTEDSELTTANPLYTTRDIRDGNVPVKFCCSAIVCFVIPDEPKRFVKYVCASCQKRYEVRDVVNVVDNPDFNVTVKCPHCSASLSLTMEFSLILRDETGFLDAIASPVVVKKMFPEEVDPPKLLTDEKVQTMASRNLKFLISKEYRIVFEIERFLRPDGKSVCLLKNLTHPLEPGKTGISA